MFDPMMLLALGPGDPGCGGAAVKEPAPGPASAPGVIAPSPWPWIFRGSCRWGRPPGPASGYRVRLRVRFADTRGVSVALT
jgi:hypothetical protein